MFKVQIRQRTVLVGIGALSGIERVQDALYFIGDDVAYVRKTNLSLHTFENIHLFNQHQNTQPMDKAQKPDIEGMGAAHWQGQNWLLLLGSGSTERRKSIRRINLDTQQADELYSAENYNFFEQQVIDSNGHELNLEAISADDSQVYIMQRGHLDGQHWGIAFDLNKFFHGVALADAFRSRFFLHPPHIDGFASGISGMCTVNTGQMLCTASVETSANSYDDGEILGSFVGWIDLHHGHEHWQLLTDAQGQALRVKVEGITLLESTPHGLHCWLVTDNDGGDSEVIEVFLMAD